MNFKENSNFGQKTKIQKLLCEGINTDNLIDYAYFLITKFRIINRVYTTWDFTELNDCQRLNKKPKIEHLTLKQKVY